MIDHVEKEQILRTPGMGIFQSTAENVAPASLPSCSSRRKGVRRRA